VTTHTPAAEFHLAAAAHGRAGFVSRAIADVIDAAIVWAAATLVAIGAAVLRSVVVGSALELPRLGIPAATLVPLAYLMYLWFFWTTTGRTVGKLAMGLRLVTTAGDQVSGLRAFGRALMCVVFPIGLAWTIVSARNAAIHDLLFGTAVVYDWNDTLNPERRRTDT
jgi:uncharacterized RDD family membrane protein YckC